MAIWFPVVIFSVLWACNDGAGDNRELSKARVGRATLRLGERQPAVAENEVVGRLAERIERGASSFRSLVQFTGANVVFKDEERTGADRHMTPRLRIRLERLAQLTEREWPGIRLRVTEAWDEEGEHGRGSLHYEGRAADLTTTDGDLGKLGRLAQLAVDAELDWVFYESADHVHVSVRR